jgi:hypothetical protein
MEFDAFCSWCERTLGFEPGQWLPGKRLVDDLGFDSLDWVSLQAAMADLGFDLYEHYFDGDITVDQLFAIFHADSAVQTYS